MMRQETNLHVGECTNRGYIINVLGPAAECDEREAFLLVLCCASACHGVRGGKQVQILDAFQTASLCAFQHHPK